MRRLVIFALLIACSAKGPSGTPPAEAPRAVPPAQAVEESGAVPVPAAAPTDVDPREAALARTVDRLLEQDHLLHKKVDGTLSRAAFDEYMDRLDADKMFLLQSDRAALSKYADQIGDELRSGSLDLAHEGEKIFVQRIDTVDKMIQELLAQPMNHDDDEWVETDPKKMQPATTVDELRDRWRKRLELQVMERVGQMEDRLEKKKKAEAEKKKPGTGTKAEKDAAEHDEAADTEEDKSMPVAEIPPTADAREAKARADLAKQYAGRFARLRHPEPLDAATDLVNAVAATFDPHTDYLPPADKANFDIHMTGSLEGIGASLRERDHYIEVVELVPGGAAWRHGGLAPGDTILAVQNTGKDSVDVVDMKLDDVVSMIRGPKGTIVRLRVQKPDGHEETLAITRDVVVIEESYARGAVLKAKNGVNYGYIHLPAFYGGPSGGRTASADVRKLLDELAKRKVAGVVLDIRSNGGGLLQDAVKLTGEFIDKGPVVQVRDSDGKREVLADTTSGTDFDGPVIVLVDRFSASASEILAGALQDYHRAVIVGTGPTHGKGTVQTLVDLDRIAGRKEDLGDLKLTIEQFFRVSGASTQLEGVTPDVLLPDPAGYLDTGEKKLDHPIAWSQIDAVPHDDWKATWKTPQLVAKSGARIAKDPLLSKIATANTLLRSERENTRMPLKRSEWETRHKQLQTALDAASPDLVHAPAAFAVTTIGDPDAPAAPPGPGVKADDRPKRWRDALARDPWIAESVAILGDMAGK
jgi:carboxyl-terminal processing protease